MSFPISISLPSLYNDVNILTNKHCCCDFNELNVNYLQPCFCYGPDLKYLKDTGTAPLIFEPRHEKTCLRGLRQSKTQTGLCSYGD